MFWEDASGQLKIEGDIQLSGPPVDQTSKNLFPPRIRSTQGSFAMCKESYLVYHMLHILPLLHRCQPMPQASGVRFDAYATGTSAHIIPPCIMKDRPMSVHHASIISPYHNPHPSPQSIESCSVHSQPPREFIGVLLEVLIYLPVRAR